MARSLDWVDNQIKTLPLVKTPYTQIQALLQVSRHIIKDVKDDIMHSHEFSGTAHKFTDEIMEFIQTNGPKDATVSDAAIAGLVQKTFKKSFTRQTLCNVRGMLGFLFPPGFTIRLMNDGHREARVIFCGGIRELIGEGTQIIFDEERFYRGPDNTWRRS
jgi:hypothetical protein